MLPPVSVDHWDDYLIPLLTVLRRKAPQPSASPVSHAATTFIDDAGHGLDFGQLPCGGKDEIITLLKSKKSKVLELGCTREGGLGVSYFTLQRLDARWVFSRTDISPKVTPAASTSSIAVPNLGEVVTFLEGLEE
jgi:hypothetical protein